MWFWILIKGSIILQCYLIMDLIKFSWYLIHLERMVRNGNSVTTDMIEDTLELPGYASFCFYSVKFSNCFWTFFLQCRISTTNIHCKRLFLPVTKACTNKLFIFKQCMFIYWQIFLYMWNESFFLTGLSETCWRLAKDYSSEIISCSAIGR